VSEDDKPEPQRGPSRSAEAAAVRWGEKHPEDDVEHPPPWDAPESDGGVPNRHSASAEAASLRWHEQHPDEDEQA
jgi:hypothetical protein